MKFLPLLYASLAVAYLFQVISRASLCFPFLNKKLIQYY